MAAILPKVAQGAANSLLRRAGNYSQKKSESNSKPKVPQGQGGQAMFRFLGDVGASVGGATPPGLGVPRGDDEDPLLLWQGVSLTYRGVPTLANCSGYVTRGEFLCVLGPGSGSDRVALLDVLSGRAVSGSIEGHFAYDGRRFTKEHLLELSTYVPQETSFLAHATCEEAIYFVAKLRLARETTEADVARRCTESLKTTELDGCRDEFVGGSLGGGRVVVGLSAVQRRQLSIAVGLVAQPRLMFAENPTRGLDAAAALRFVRLVGTLCDGGLAAVCAVNAPRRSIWSLFRSCYVMSCGHVLYAGPTEGAVPWFRSIGYFRGETTGNPADLVLDLVAIDCDKPGVAHTLRTISDVVTAFRQFAATAAPKIEAKAHAFPLAADGNGDVAGSLSFGDDDASPLDGPKRYVASFLAAFPHIFARTLRAKWRHPQDLALRLSYLLCVLAVGAIIFGRAKLRPDDRPPWETGPVDHASPSYAEFTHYLNAVIVWLVATFASIVSVQAVFFEDCHRARGDIEVGLYTTAPFLAAYGAVEFFLACVILLSLLTCACAYTHEDALMNTMVSYIVHLASCHLPMFALLMTNELGPRSAKFMQFDFKDKYDALTVTFGTFVVPLMRVHVVAENAPLPSKATEAHFEQVLKSYERALLQHGCSIDEIRAISERADINLDGDSVITPKRTISDSELAGAARPPPAAAAEAPPDLAPSYVPYTPIDDAPGDVPPLEDAYDEPGLLAPAPTPPGFRYDVGDEVNI
ncbi:ATPase [Aureococcus anophagefferens]|nr:ATPase [Aureococcus anophagefferens]